MFANLDVEALMGYLEDSNVWCNESNDRGIIFPEFKFSWNWLFLGGNSSVLYT